MNRDDLLSAAASAARDDPRVLALFVTGSLACGEGDEHSDLDTVLVVGSEALAEMVSAAREWVAQFADLVLWRQVHPPYPLFHAITEDWQRLDVTIAAPDCLTLTKDRARPLLDRTNLYDGLPEHPAERPLRPETIGRLVEEFLRVLGLAPVALGRGDYVGGVTGVALLRGLLIELMVAEQNPLHPPGAKSLSRVLPAADIALLKELPNPQAARDPVLAANLALAAAFLPRARRLAVKTGLDWPQRLETACRARLHRELGAELPA